jgi:uncharacterized protein (DUF2062 family)
MVRKRSRSIPERFRRIFRYIYLRLVRVGGDPVHIGLGFAVGVFLGIFPTFGVGTPLALLIASLLRWNRISAVLGSLVMNPFTVPFFWTLSGSLGAAIFRVDAKNVLQSVGNGERMKSLSEAALIYLTGNTLIALAGAVVSYFVSLKLITAYRKKRQELWKRTHPPSEPDP